MAKSHWKSKRKFGRAGGLHCKSFKYRPVESFCCTSVSSIKFNIKKCKTWKKKKSLRRKLLSRYVKKEISTKQFRCIPSKGSINLILKRIRQANIKGYRLINLDSLQKHMNIVINHCISCTKAHDLVQKGSSCVEIESETRRHGLASILAVRCVACKVILPFETSPKMKTGNSTKYDINVRAVWGSIVTGNGASHLKEIMATMDAPSLSQPAFSHIEQTIGTWWENISQQEILDAGSEERRIAIEKGCYHQGVPCITVIADGGWSKRTHKHSYNALGGMAIIIGKETGKLLHLGIRNKYCYHCSYYENRQEPIPHHVCYKNWESNSQAMEADVIVDGFRVAEKVHGVRYLWLVADGDSSVYAKIHEEVPVWGKDVQKIECANHVCKCLRSSLERLVENNASYKGKGKLTKATRVRLVSAVRCAIRMRSREEDKRKAAAQLAKDVLNSIHHIFGNHKSCSDFCKYRGSCASDIPDTDCGESPEQTEHNEEAASVCVETALLWTEGSSIESQEQSRLDSGLRSEDLEPHMLQDVALLLNRVAEKSTRLIHNTTTNLAESWMHIRTKFDGGKVYNLCNRGSWHTRCYGGSLRMNAGPKWSPKVWKICTGTLAGHNFESLYNERERDLLFSNKSKTDPKQSALRWKRKMSSCVQATTKSAKAAYGPEAVDVVEDVSKEELDTKMTRYMETHLQLSAEKLAAIETITQMQSSSQVWVDERKKRITTSNFGSVIKRRPVIPVKKLVQNMLYSNFQGNNATQRGLREERNTVQEYILKKAESGVNVVVRQSGLVVHEECQYLGGSPDGVVYINSEKCGLIEVKNLLHNKSINLYEAAKSSNTFCLKIENDNLALKRNHNYYYQCQGLLQICQLPWIDFIVRTLNPYQLHIERIHRDDSVWPTWLLKLKAFYTLALLPELVCPRVRYYPGIREPGVWFDDTQRKVLTKKRQCKQRPALRRSVRQRRV